MAALKKTSRKSSGPQSAFIFGNDISMDCIFLQVAQMLSALKSEVKSENKENGIGSSGSGTSFQGETSTPQSFNQVSSLVPFLRSHISKPIPAGIKGTTEIPQECNN